MARLRLWLRKTRKVHPPGICSAWFSYIAATITRLEAALHQALRLRPGDAYARNNRALVLLRLGKAAESRLEADRAIAARPEEPGFLANLGYACEALRDYAAMADAFERALSQGADPRNAVWRSPGRVAYCGNGLKHAPRWPPCL